MPWDAACQPRVLDTLLETGRHCEDVGRRGRGPLPSAIGEAAYPGGVEALFRALTEDNPYGSREAVTEAASEMGAASARANQRCVAEASEAATRHDESPGLKQRAAHALGKMGAASGQLGEVGVLLAMLDEGDEGREPEPL